MKKIIITLACLLGLFIFTGCADDFDEREAQKMDDLEKASIKEQQEKEEEALNEIFVIPEKALPTTISIPAIEELGYTLGLVTENSTIYRVKSADDGSIFFRYHKMRYSEPFLMNGVEQSTEVESYIQLSYKIINPFSEIHKGIVDDMPLVNAISERKRLEEKYSSLPENSEAELIVSTESSNSVKTVESIGNSVLPDGWYNVNYVEITSPYSIVISLYAISDEDYSIIFPAFEEYAQSLGKIYFDEVNAYSVRTKRTE